jgi:ATP-dependent RNA helicase DDX56/DBP9
MVADSPDIIIATPSRVLNFVQAKVRDNSHYFSDVHSERIVQTLDLSSLESLVIDEADLVLSYGHDEDIQQIFNGGYLPKVFQSFLMSATMTEDVEKLKGLALRNPVRRNYTYERTS